MQCVKSGNPQRERAAIGEGHDTEGSRWLVERVDAGTPERPLEHLDLGRPDGSRAGALAREAGSR